MSNKYSRRSVLGGLLAISSGVLGQVIPKGRASTGTKLRPPGAVGEKEFLAKCIRCFKCSDVCENSCIQFHPFKAGLDLAFTPYIHARDRGCTSCMKCTQVCPTGALTPLEADEETVLAEVNMGVARLNRDMCYSYVEPARTCGVCYRACPFPGKAMSITLWERPVVHHDQCIGCGLCEQACVHLPQAIRIIPANRS